MIVIHVVSGGIYDKEVNLLRAFLNVSWWFLCFSAPQNQNLYQLSNLNDKR